MSIPADTYDAFMAARQTQESLLMAYSYQTAENGPLAGTYLNAADREFRRLAAHLGYRVEKIAEPAAAAEREAA